MKKLAFILIASLACSFMAVASFAADGMYVSGSLGVASVNDSDLSDSTGYGTIEFDPGFSFAAAVGYAFGSARIEGELAYQENDYDSLSLTIPGLGSASGAIDGDATVTSLLLNGYFDFKNDSKFTPYVGGGIGMANVEVGAISIPGIGAVTTSADDDVFAYQLTAGFGVEMTEKVELDFKYRYFATSDPDFEGTNAEFSSNNLYAGVRVGF